MPMCHLLGYRAVPVEEFEEETELEGNLRTGQKAGRLLNQGALLGCLKSMFFLVRVACLGVRRFDVA